MSPWLDDGDVRLYHGDALQVLAELEDGSVDCVVTSPPYWGLRDYGTGAWADGDPECDHLAPLGGGFRASTLTHGPGQPLKEYEVEQVVRNRQKQYGAECGKCGARRTDQQLGLEPTPDQFVANMVAVFREVRRVLAEHGTCWVNLGDSYANPPASGTAGQWNGSSPLGSNNNAMATAEGSRKTGGTISGGLKQKDLCGIPWRVAFALQQDGWYLRSDIVWAKPNPMPESVTDRPTKSHEYVFLLTRQPRYFFDQEAVREPLSPATLEDTRFQRAEAGETPYGKENGKAAGLGRGPRVKFYPGRNDGDPDSMYKHPSPAGRNVRSVWQIATQPYPEAHFATFPEELARRAILAGCPLQVCRVCGKPRERIVEREPSIEGRKNWAGHHASKDGASRIGGFYDATSETLGWSDCGHNQYRPGTVLDPFIGSGTVAKVARDHGRHSIGIDLNETYLELAARRLQQLSLLT